MTLKTGRSGTAAAVLILGIVPAMLAAGAAPLAAQQPNPETKAEWERRLAPPPGPPGFRSLFDRGVKVEPGKAAPSVELYLNFAFDSADLDPDGMRTLQSLAAALKGKKLKGAKLKIVGHTDAKGTVEYNQKLSERRASAVMQFLTAVEGIDPGRLQASGRGKSQPKDPAAPLDGINRRVEIRNVSAVASQ